MKTMRALTLPSYGSTDRLSVSEMPLPEPKAGEVRVRVMASAINPADKKVATGEMKILHGREFPMVLGYDFSGVVDAVGSGVANPVPGREVFGFLHYGGRTKRGAFSEYLIATPDMMAPKPPAISHLSAAASATPGVTALIALRDKGGVRSGSKVLIIGASGGVGCLAVGIAKLMGATVTGVCGPHAVDFVKQVGADVVVDRSKQDPLKLNEIYDVVFDAASVHSFGSTGHMLAPEGAYVTLLPSPGFVVGLMASMFSSKKCRVVMTSPKTEYLKEISAWMQAGWKIPLDSTIDVKDVAKGIERLDRGEMLGRIAVRIEGGF